MPGVPSCLSRPKLIILILLNASVKAWQIRGVACHFCQCIPIPFPNILCSTSLGHPPILLILERISFAACQLKSLKPGIHTCHRSSQAHPGKSIYQFHTNFISYQTILNTIDVLFMSYFKDQLPSWDLRRCSCFASGI